MLGQDETIDFGDLMNGSKTDQIDKGEHARN